MTTSCILNKQFRIQETLNLSASADSSTDTNKKNMPNKKMLALRWYNIQHCATNIATYRLNLPRGQLSERKKEEKNINKSKTIQGNKKTIISPFKTNNFLKGMVD